MHPEYEVPKKRPARRTEEDEEMARKRAEARRKKQHQERRRKIIRRRKQKQALRLVAACLVIAALVVTVFSVKNYNSGSRHDNKGMNAYESGDYDTAVNEFKEAISYDGSNADYYIHRMWNRNPMMRLLVISTRQRGVRKMMTRRRC